MADDDAPAAAPPPTPTQAATPFLIGGAMIGLLALVFAMPSFIIIAAGMIPTVLARVLPMTPEQKSGALTIAMLNFAGVLPVLAMLWSRGHNIGNALGLLGEPLPWMLMLGTSAIAVMLQSVLPNAAISVMERAAVQRVHKLKGQQRELVAEWGAEVKGEAAPEPEPEQSPPAPSA